MGADALARMMRVERGAAKARARKRNQAVSPKQRRRLTVSPIRRRTLLQPEEVRIAEQLMQRAYGQSSP
jgi:hypothetical protein